MKWLLLVSSLAWGCTFEPGEGFATLESATLRVRLEPGEGRDLGDDSILSDLGYRIALTSATLNVEQARVEERLNNVLEAGFDAGDQSFGPTLILPVNEDLDVLGEPVVPLTEVEPSRKLPQAHLARAALVLRALSLQGSVSGGPAGGGLGDAGVPFEAHLAQLGSVFQALDFTVNRAAPESLALRMELVLSGTLCDGIDFARLASSGSIDLGDPAAAPVIQLAQNVLTSRFTAQFSEAANAP